MTELNLPPPFIGREQELNFLKEKVDCAKQSAQGSTVFIAAESGVGKTRLVKEIINYAEQNGFQTFREQCLLDSLTPFMPITEMLREAGLDHLILHTTPPKLESFFLYTNTGKLVSKLKRDIEHGTQNIESKIKDKYIMNFNLLGMAEL